MRKIYLSIIVMAFSFSVTAQVTLTKAFNQPALGNINTKQLYDSVGIVPKYTGANQIWDFSSYTISSNTEVSNYIAPTAAPNGASYTGVTFVESFGNGNYFYMKVTPTRYELVGVQHPNFKLNLSTNAGTQFMWPISMGYSLSDAFSGTANANNMNGNVYGNITTLGAGTGTLILPGGMTYSGVLQVKMSLSANASFLFGITTVALKVVEYTYYDVNNKFPLLTVTYTDVSGAYTSKSAHIKVNATIVGLNDLSIDDSFSISPNPAKDYFKVSLYNPTNANCTIEIMNAVGQTLQLVNLANEVNIFNDISVSNLASGMYLVKTTLGDKVSVRKLIKE
jgi:hypothetical protein